MANKKRKIPPIKPAPYTGLKMQAPVQRNTAPQYGGSSTSISQGGMAEPQEQSGGGLESLLAGKEAYDQMGEMYQSGEDLQKGILGMPEKAGNVVDYLGERYDDIATPVADWWNKGPVDAPIGSYGNAVPNSYGALQAADYANSPALQTMNEFGLGGDIVGSGQGMLTQGGRVGSLFPTGVSQGMSGAIDASGVGMNLPSGGGAFAGANDIGSLSTAGTTGQGLQNASEAAEAATAASAAEASMLSKAGALAGLGLNAYDMFDQGVTANNAMGLLGSGIMAGTTMMGLSNAWNPLGWGLLGASAIGGLTDWW
jgi:hypothetical protein